MKRTGCATADHSRARPAALAWAQRPLRRPAWVLALWVVAAASTGLVSAQAPQARRSGLQDISPALQAMQTDDAQNPAMLAVADGAALWHQAASARGLACASCHGAAERSMRGVATRYPAFDAPSGRVLNLHARVNQCQQRHQQASPWLVEAPAALALGAYLGLQSRGLPIAPAAPPAPEPEPALPSAAAAPPAAAPAATAPDTLLALQAQGRALWQQRLGQLNLTCAHCHDQHAGQRLAGALIPQGHATGYPAYRLEWQGLGSLQRRMRSCLVGVRAQPFEADAPEWLALEAWLALRAAGMPVETPAVRP
jgi:sulfur-oxidizing protein SoxA